METLYLMTPYEAQIVDQERIEMQDAIAQERQIEGMTDAAFAYLPRYADDEYLNGYVQGIKSMRRDSSDKIIYYCKSNNSRGGF